MSWSDDKELLPEVDAIGWNFLKKKKKLYDKIDVNINQIKFIGKNEILKIDVWIFCFCFYNSKL